MKPTATYTLRPGQTLAHPVLNKNGMVMLGAGTQLTDKYIERLRTLGITDIFVEEDTPRRSPGTESPAVPAAQEKMVRKRSAAASKKAVDEAFDELINNPFIGQQLSVPMLGDRFLRIYQSLLGELSDHRFMKDRLTLLHLKDPLLFEHTLNVATLSAIIGFAKQYAIEPLHDLIVSALLFDIGMIHLPDELLTKKGRLTEYDRGLIERHTNEGYQMLAHRTDVPNAAALCALQHHERYDGSGYPSGIGRSQIHEFAQIIALADTYDALVSRRHHRSSYTRRDAFEFLLGSGDRMFDLSLVKLFISHISIYPIGSRVILNSGQTAVIASVDSSLVQRPVVKIILEKDGSYVVVPYEIDLRVQYDLVIVDTAL
ncbi:HD-GYP domain-containing protein [Cohnella nanjingensis]|uniref:HD domain-containing protein n=1 Tax=Cohnella nanjingensis TaxID=1387779 RepID=A0A7X0RLY6_9BACL|nr:HD domain-containing phosphohydrolase [Cohnella nanjingensis]MBB6669972.1 HD domain-containing protein [Cohnella nanjingensis]